MNLADYCSSLLNKKTILKPVCVDFSRGPPYESTP